MSEHQPEPYRALDGHGGRGPSVHIVIPDDSEPESEAQMIADGTLCPDGLPNKVVPLRRPHQSGDLLNAESKWLGEKVVLEIDGLERPLYDPWRGVFVIPAGLTPAEKAGVYIVLMNERR